MLDGIPSATRPSTLGGRFPDVAESGELGVGQLRDDPEPLVFENLAELLLRFPMHGDPVRSRTPEQERPETRARHDRAELSLAMPPR